MPGRVRLRTALGFCHPASPPTALALLIALTFSAASWVRQVPPFRDVPPAAANGTGADCEAAVPRPPALYDVGVSSDGERICLRAFDRPAGVYDLSSGNRLSSCDDLLRLDSRIALSPNGCCVAVGLHQGGGLVLAEVGEVPRRLGGPAEPCPAENRAVMAVTFSDDGRWLASGTHGDGGSVLLWDTRTWQQRGRLDNEVVGFKNIVFSPDGSRIAAVIADGRVAVWEPARAAVNYYGDGQHFIRDVAFVDAGQSIVTGGDDGALWKWTLGTAGERHLLDSGGPHIMSVAASRNGALLAFADTVGRVTCIAALTGKLLATWHVSSLALAELKFSHDGTRLYGAGHDGVLTIWSTESLEIIRRMTLSETGQLVALTATP